MQYIQFIPTILIGFFVILLYWVLLPHSKYTWGGIVNPSLRSFISFSVFFSAISYLIIWVKEVFFNYSFSFLFLFGNLLFLFGSFLWPLFLFYYPTKFHRVILALCIASLGSFLLLIHECLDDISVVGIFFSTYLFFHVFIMDNIVWSSFYRQLFPKSAKNAW